MITGRVAVVTGGSRGIGLAIARVLLQQGAKVAIIATSEHTLQEAGRELASLFGETTVLPVRADVRNHAEIEQAIDTVVRQFGGLDILVNNAGVGVFRSVAQMSNEEWDRVLSTNLTGAFYCSRAVLPHMRARGGGWIVNISSLSGKHPFAEAAAYCASKAALNAFSEALMQEVRHDGIRVSCVLPGSVRTEFSGRNVSDSDDWKLAPEDVARMVSDLLEYPARSLPSAVEIRSSRPPKKG